MKPPEQWADELDGKIAAVDEKDVAKFIGAIASAQIETIRAIQLDASRAGMTKAAEEIQTDCSDPNCGSQYCRERREAVNEIFSLRDELTKLP